MGFGDAFRGGLWQSLVRRLYVLAIASVVFGVLTTVVVTQIVGEPPGPGPRFLPFVLTSLKSDMNQAFVDRLHEKTGLDLSVYDDKGALLVSTKDVLPLPDLATLASAADETVIYRSRIGDVVMPLRLVDGRRVFVAADMGPPPVTPALFVFGTAIFVVLALLAVVFTTLLARPLGELSKSAEAFGRGDLLSRADPQKAGAFDGLARTFNEMADRITASMNAEKELLANVSHELRTPLSRIRVALDLADEGDAALARESLKDIAEDLAELEHIIDDVLTAARFDKRMQGAVPKLHIEDVPVALLIDKAAARFKASHAAYVLDVDNTSTGVIRADPTLLRRALDNLLDNAAKYSEEASAVRLEVADQANGVRISVIDHGIGMSPEELSQLFTPFFRAEKSRARKKGGVGLGLVLSRRIVEAHGGTLEVNSEPSKGTTVTLIIPFAPSETQTATS